MKFLSVAVISTISIFILGGSAVPTGSIFENIKTDPESYEICARDPTSKRCEGVNEQLFRDVESNPILSSSDLKLPLNNFAVQALSNGLPDSCVIVDPETLCTLLAKAEKWNDKSTLLQGVKPARIKRKYRQRTPDEQLTMSDKDKVKEDERRMRRKTEKADKSYGEEGLLAEASSQEAI